MAEQPKLREGLAEADWWHVAREFRDHDMETEGGWQPHTTMEPVTDDCYIGDWLPVEDVCKEVVRLRAENAKLQSKLDYFGKVMRDESEGENRLLAENAKLRAAGEALLEIYSYVPLPEEMPLMERLGEQVKQAKAEAAWREAAGESREAAGKERSDGE